VLNLIRSCSFAAALAACAIPAWSMDAQGADAAALAAEYQQSRSVNEAKRQATIGANVAFTLEESQRFWPLFWEYRTEVGRVDDRYVELLVTFSDNFGSMSEKQAAALIDAWLEIQADRSRLQQEYVAKFKEALPAAKVIRVVQVENKLDAMMNAALAKRVPLLSAP